MSMPSKGKIFDYWKDMCITQEGGACKFITSKFGIENVYYPVGDWGEPSCWACGCNTNSDINNVEASLDQIKSNWDRAPLQKCHIIPRSLGGTNDPYNLFLMCHTCHDKAPNTTETSLFFKWVFTRKIEYDEEVKNKINSLIKEIAKYGEFSMKEKSIILSIFFKEGVDEYTSYIFKEKDITILNKEYSENYLSSVGLHRNQEFGGCVITDSSMIGIICKFIFEKKNKKYFISLNI